MRIIVKRCQICDGWHNHIACPYCGAVKLGAKHIDVANGRELVRSRHLGRVAEEIVMRPISVSELNERIIPRLAR